MKYSIRPQEIPRASPSDFPSRSGYISLYIPLLVTIQIQYEVIILNIPYVSLWDPESTKFQGYFGHSPRNWRTLIHFNVFLTVFHIDHISQGVCKTVGTTFWYIIVLQSRGEGPKKAHNYGTDSGQIFRTFSSQLENNDTLKCSSDSFAHTLRYEALSGWGSVKVLLDIIFKIQEN